ncbi:carbon-nitrogen hydrolase family protein [Acetobacter indonesiensis]|uniref:Carbon-nitrogen hydrolase n=1 Tax=Acetobacter indonesiensis TaxID=104101 RepID=A0A252ASL3_9PROT|nr:carbon-nitrogen hydrolase family protein [Acetobacter indonesiensis]OUI93185.1 carbon-nitrogen hydrolase [Acetobacter indonesiensis]
MLTTLIQFQATDNKDRNIAAVQNLVETAFSRQKARLISLPEMWSCRNADRSTRFAAAELLPRPNSTDTGGDAYQAMQHMARHYGVYVHGGSIAEKVGEQLYNTTLVFNPQGQEIGRYRKMHLFDVTAPDGTIYRESKDFGAGNSVVTCQIDNFIAGLTICYDLRFPELFRALRDKGADVIFVPSAFTMETGKDHWEVLLRARAIENQVWIIAAGICGSYRSPTGDVKSSYGHSLVCDPWGHVVALASDGPGSVTAWIDHAHIEKVRAAIPLATHRRPELNGFEHCK